MIRTSFCFALAVLTSVVLLPAQEAKRPGPNASGNRPEPATAPADNHITYLVEMKIMEGKGLLGRKLAQQSSIDPPLGQDRRMSDPEPAAAVNPRQEDALRAESPPRAENHGLWDQLTREPGVSVISAPRATVYSDIPATFEIQASRTFDYLEALGHGKFEAKRSPPSALGMKFRLGVQPVEGDENSVELAPLEIQSTTLDGREPVEGLDLDVGKPIIATRSLKTTARVKLGAVRIIAIPSGPKTEAAIMLRVTRMELPAE